MHIMYTVQYTVLYVQQSCAFLDISCIVYRLLFESCMYCMSVYQFCRLCIVYNIWCISKQSQNYGKFVKKISIRTVTVYFYFVMVINNY